MPTSPPKPAEGCQRHRQSPRRCGFAVNFPPSVPASHSRMGQTAIPVLWIVSRKPVPAYCRGWCDLRRTTGSEAWCREVLSQFPAENRNGNNKAEILEETQISNHLVLEMYTTSIYNVARRSRTREQGWGTDESERFESKISPTMTRFNSFA